MGWTGTGSFDRKHSWVKDAQEEIGISPERMDEEFDNIKEGLQNCLTKTGETKPTAHQNMSGYRHVNVAKAEQRDEYATVGQIIDHGFIWAGISTGKLSTYKVTMNPGPYDLLAGLEIKFIAHKRNEGPVLMRINELKDTPIIHADGEELKEGDMPEGAVIQLIYNGQAFQIQEIQCISSKEVDKKIDSLERTPVGVISAYAGKTPPEGWLMCDGKSYDAIAQDGKYKSLYDVIGTIYGGQGDRDFFVPDLRERSIIGCSVSEDKRSISPDRINYKSALFESSELGATGGESEHKLSIDEMPSHDHDYEVLSSQKLGAASGNAFNTFGEKVKTSVTGGDQGHNNVQPSMLLNYIIKH